MREDGQGMTGKDGRERREDRRGDEEKVGAYVSNNTVSTQYAKAVLSHGEASCNTAAINCQAVITATMAKSFG